MATAKQIADRLRRDHACMLNDEQIFAVLSDFEEYIADRLNKSVGTFDKDGELTLSNGHNELYIHHVLSREALMNDDSRRFENHAAVCRQLIKDITAQGGGAKYKNIW